MNKFSILCFVLVSLTFLVFLSADYNNKNEYTPPEHVTISNEINDRVIETLTSRHKMSLFGVSQSMIDYVNRLELSFLISGPKTKIELRKIVVDSMEEYLKAINSNERIRPFLKKYPFTPKEISLTFYLVDEKGIEIFDPNISFADAVREKIIYIKIDKSNPTKYKSTEEENYEDALKIVKKEQK